ncbi:Rrf2 family transcriptional regulator [Nakamurella endophytica]|uniref:Rrf2 family transcriptional regulator n=1 Tax=Nakamurella endophytica TaxID=1748367 RepID=A0A917T8K3_9ACTN|nr:Rrf2 family transcriptional regulator [Nakamurella endophytica]GGM14490.1 Rrf2 family transcriptional regulator [Nakamurella endophytica]
MATPLKTRFAVAVHVLTYLAATGDGRAVGATELAASTRVTPVHVRRVLGPLRRAGLVASRPGVHGGWVLRGRPADVTLGQVWRLLQGDDPVLGLHGPDPRCPIGRRIGAALSGYEREVAAAVEATLGRRTVQDVLDESAAGVAAPIPTG